jgi:N-acetylglutamate synthase-like GNAT family acetyltransferase
MNPAVQPLIRDATANDAEAVAALLTELGYPAAANEAAMHLARFEHDPASRVQVAEDAGKIIGLVATHIVPRLDNQLLSCRITDIVVAASQRRKRIGSALLAAAEAEARRHGAARLDLSSGDWRMDAQSFYAEAGFRSNARSFTKDLA